MSYYSVQNPANFVVYPSYTDKLQAPVAPLHSITRLTTFPVSKILTVAASLSPSDISTGQIFINPGSSGLTFTLPSADSLWYFLQGTAAELHQGDILSINIVNLASATGTLAAGSGGAGSKILLGDTTDSSSATQISQTTPAYIHFVTGASGLAGGAGYLLY
jgi:hypothetical protein